MSDKKWTFNRDGILEDVPLERWAWEVRYKGGVIFKQFDDDGVFHQIGEVIQDEVEVFSLVSAKQRIDIELPVGAKLIHKYKNYIFNAGTKIEQRIRVYVIGYKNGNQSLFNFILPDDTIVQSQNDNLTLTFGS